MANPTTFSLVVTACLLGIAASASAEERSCNEEMVKKHPLPPTLSKEVVVPEILGRPLTGEDDRQEVACAVYSRVWKIQKQPTLLVFLETGTPTRASDLRIGMYQQQPDGRYRMVAKSAAPYDLEEGENERITFLDFAPYKLTPTEYAFGVRATQPFPYSAGYGKNVIVFRVQGDAIVQVLGTLMSSWWADRPEGGWRSWPDSDRMLEDDVSEGDKATSVISVLKTRTQGSSTGSNGTGGAHALSSGRATTTSSRDAGSA